MKDLSVPVQPPEEERPEEEYPLIRRCGHNDVIVEWYPHFQSVGPIESIMEGADRYYKCKFAQQKLMEIKFCSNCNDQIEQLPWYFSNQAVSDRETYAWINRIEDEDENYYMPEIILKLCREDQPKFYNWITEEVFDIQYPSLEIAIMQAQIIMLKNSTRDEVQSLKRRCEFPDPENLGASANVGVDEDNDY